MVQPIVDFLDKCKEPDLHHNLGLLAHLGYRVTGGDLDVELPWSGCQNPAAQQKTVSAKNLVIAQDLDT